jgi:glycosyltransferase involved in cell wall biosynthesis
MSLLFLIPNLGIGGAERQLVLLANELARRGQRVVVAVFRGGGALESELDRQRVEFVDLRKGSRWDLLGFTWRLFRVIRSIQPAIVHGYSRRGNLASLLSHLAWSRATIVWGIRDSNLQLADWGWLARIVHVLATVFARFADRIVANSKAGLEHFVACGYPRSKMIHIPNGVDTARFRPNPEGGRRFREAVGLGDADKVVGLVGRLHPMKDHWMFLKAAALVAPGEPRVRFICMGNGPEEYKRKLQVFSEELGIASKVLWFNADPNMEPVYNALDVVCSTSSCGEGFSNVVGEAMACGCHCIVTDVGDSSFIVDGAGVVVPPRQPQTLAAAIRAQLKQHTRGRAPKPEARERILSHFSVSLLASRTEQILFPPNLSTLGPEPLGSPDPDDTNIHLALRRHNPGPTRSRLSTE